MNNPTNAIVSDRQIDHSYSLQHLTPGTPQPGDLVLVPLISFRSWALRQAIIAGAANERAFWASRNAR